MKNIESESDFNEELKKAGDKLVVVDFFATWCGPCRVIGPKLEVMSKELTDVVFIKVDVDEVEEVAMKYQVQAMPTFKFFKKGEEIPDSQVVGANEANIKAVIMKHK